jgi:HAD superfamily hydrolase (TIGR01490 family)
MTRESLMTPTKTVLAIFDFDGTLTTGHLWAGISSHHHQKKVKRMAVYLYILSHMPFWLAAKLKVYSEEKNRAKWGADLPVLFKGFTREEMEKVFDWVTDHYFVPRLRPDVLAVLKEHQKQGHKIMLLSGMFSEFLEVVGRRIGVDYVVGSRLEIVNSRCTGRIVPPLCFGENKAVMLSAYIKQKQLAVDCTLSSAYADSIFDSPVFRLVGRPVATYPDKKLYRLASAERWQIIGSETLNSKT